MTLRRRTTPWFIGFGTRRRLPSLHPVLKNKFHPNSQSLSVLQFLTLSDNKILLNNVTHSLINVRRVKKEADPMVG